MPTLNGALSLITILGMICIARGYRSALEERGTATWHFAVSTLILALTYGGRRIYWDVITPYLSINHPEFWRWLYDAHGGQSVNIVFNTISLIAIYHGLTARWLLLPDEDRPNWRWWNAWAHPEGIAFFWRR